MVSWPGVSGSIGILLLVLVVVPGIPSRQGETEDDKSIQEIHRQVIDGLWQMAMKHYERN